MEPWYCTIRLTSILRARNSWKLVESSAWLQFCSNQSFLNDRGSALFNLFSRSGIRHSRASKSRWCSTFWERRVIATRRGSVERMILLLILMSWTWNPDISVTSTMALEKSIGRWSIAIFRWLVLGEVRWILQVFSTKNHSDFRRSNWYWALAGNWLCPHNCRTSRFAHRISTSRCRYDWCHGISGWNGFYVSWIWVFPSLCW